MLKTSTFQDIFHFVTQIKWRRLIVIADYVRYNLVIIITFPTTVWHYCSQLPKKYLAYCDQK